jgi:hypothetical protein
MSPEALVNCQRSPMAIPTAQSGLVGKADVEEDIFGLSPTGQMIARQKVSCGKKDVLGARNALASSGSLARVLVMVPSGVTFVAMNSPGGTEISCCVVRAGVVRRAMTWRCCSGDKSAAVTSISITREGVAKIPWR